MGYLVYLLALLAALGCGLVGGALVAFSDFLMPALARVAPDSAVPVMREINASAHQSWFLRVLGVTGALSVALIVVALMRWHMPDSALLLLGAALYLAGTVLVSLVCNAPRNDLLARDAGQWPDYLAHWTRWNHVRAVSALAAAALFAMAM
ncbi:MAG TPA: anthrone oxygenase family protein [Burkholderiales bacterium]|nr:anthrone oxygenase family protein [Burkholderiales bacterium]